MSSLSNGRCICGLLPSRTRLNNNSARRLLLNLSLALGALPLNLRKAGREPKVAKADEVQYSVTISQSPGTAACHCATSAPLQTGPFFNPSPHQDFERPIRSPAKAKYAHMYQQNALKSIPPCRGHATSKQALLQAIFASSSMPFNPDTLSSRIQITNA